MATITASVLPYKYIEAQASPVENILDITAGIIPQTKEAYDVVFLKITVGSFQFSSGETITSDSPTYTVGDEIPPISISKTYPLHLKAVAQNDSFNMAY